MWRDVISDMVLLGYHSELVEISNKINHKSGKFYIVSKENILLLNSIFNEFSRE
jgi:hypothetical protein